MQAQLQNNYDALAPTQTRMTTNADSELELYRTGAGATMVAFMVCCAHMIGRGLLRGCRVGAKDSAVLRQPSEEENTASTEGGKSSQTNKREPMPGDAREKMSIFVNEVRDSQQCVSLAA